MAASGKLGLLFGWRKRAPMSEPVMEDPIDEQMFLPPPPYGDELVDKLLEEPPQAENGATDPASVILLVHEAEQATATHARSIATVQEDLESLTMNDCSDATEEPPAGVSEYDNAIRGGAFPAGAGLDLSAELSGEIRELLIKALQKHYTSTSSHMDYKTNNAYQSVDLGGAAVVGYRRDRADLFKAFDLTGRKVLDCGSNLGELSRLARHRGADLVDGIEYDNYFVEIARLINAYHGTTRVSFQQGDLTKPETISQTYDVTMAFSVFPYILPTLEILAAATREMLILETHDISPSMKTTYFEPVSKFFPFHSFVGFSDYGHGQGRRAVFVFSKDESSLLQGGILSSTVDLRRSEFGFLGSITSLIDDIIPVGSRTIVDIARVVAQARDVPNDIGLLTTGKTYWLQMMQGYLEAKTKGAVTLDNLYLRSLRATLTHQHFDPALASELSSDTTLLERVSFRFADIDRLAAGGGGLAPITVFDFFGQDGRFRVYNDATNTTVQAQEIDGYHRVFWARFFGVVQLPAIFHFC